MAVRNFALPDLGEGLTESELVSWRVAIGDTVELNQIIAEVETAKALVELPSPFAGVVSGFFAEAGSTVAVGAPIVAFEVDDPRGTDAAAPVPEVASQPTARIEREPMLVGYGPPVEGGARPKRRARVAASPLSEEFAQPTVPEEVAQRPSRRVEGSLRPRSTPPVRSLARELGVDLGTITGTGEHGLITRQDVTAHRESAEAVASAVHVPDDGSAQQRETRTPIRGVRKHTAEAMVASAFTAPHATEFLTIDVTPTVELLARLKASREFAGQRLTMLTIVAKALCIAVNRTPAANSRWDEAAQEIIQFGYVNLGIAAATPRGLMVPNIKDAGILSLADLATALTALVETAKAGSAGPEDLRGGTISITNIGVFGIDAGTPILNPGEAAILAMGAVRRAPWEFRGEVALRDVMTLSLSFDHRLVDGEQASRFLADIGTILRDPGMLLTMV